MIYMGLIKKPVHKIKCLDSKVYDEDTGRTRLVKGDGEILEECVSQFRHKEINKAATEADGNSFRSSLNATLASK